MCPLLNTSNYDIILAGFSWLDWYICLDFHFALLINIVLGVSTVCQLLGKALKTATLTPEVIELVSSMSF